MQELSNFLLILEREEEVKRMEVVARYKEARKVFHAAMDACVRHQ